MTLRDLKIPLAFAAFVGVARGIQHWLGLKTPAWLGALSIAILIAAYVAFYFYGRKRERLSNQYLDRRKSTQTFEDNSNVGSPDFKKDAE
jgi:hypothetical protein